MWSASFEVGSFIGPTVSGFLVDAYGFESTTTVFCGLYGFILMVNTCDLTCSIGKSQTTHGYERINDKCPENVPLVQKNKETIS